MAEPTAQRLRKPIAKALYPLLETG
jgi:hypothetical protein